MPKKPNPSKIFKAQQLDTLIGPMLAIADENNLYMLEFIDTPSIKYNIERLKIKTNSLIIPGYSSCIHSIEYELKLYFQGNLKNFRTPLCPLGSSFQHDVWAFLKTISYGKTISYAQEAAAIGKPTANRAVANANAANLFSIVIPCHRIINSNGKLRGYGGGIARKQWLIDHERKNAL